MALGLLKSFFEGLFTYPIYRNYKGAFTQGVFCKVKRDRLGYFAVKNNSFRYSDETLQSLKCFLKARITISFNVALNHSTNQLPKIFFLFVLTHNQSFYHE